MGFQPDVTNRAEFQPDVIMIVSKGHANVRTEESEELFLALMHPVLEHRSFSLGFRIRLLEQNLG